MTPEGLERLRAQTRDLLEPVSIAAPAGEHDPEDPRYLEIADAAARLDSPSAASLDWAAVERAAGELLEKRSKDLLAASLLALAYYRTRGLPGLSLGCVLLSDLLDGYWSSLHPPAKRLRARGNALRVFVDRVVREPPPRGYDPDDARLAGEAVAELCRRIEQLFPEESSAADRLSRWFDEQVRTRDRWLLPARRPASERPPEPDESARAVRHDATARARAAREALPTLLEALFDAATSLRRADPADPQPYRLARAAVWLPALAAPPADAQGITRAAAPLRSLRDFVTRAESEGRPAELLDELECSLRIHPFWLDAQRVAANALAALGPEYAGARAAVEQEARALTLRLPDVATLRFADGTPFADEDTVKWLEGLASAPGARDSLGGGGGGG